jgi:hypothetical protein
MYFNTTGKVYGKVAVPAILDEDRVFKFVGAKVGVVVEKGAPVAKVCQYCARFHLGLNSSTSELECANALNELFKIYGDQCADYEFALPKLKEHFPKLNIQDVALHSCWKVYQHPADGNGAIRYSDYENVLETLRQAKRVQNQDV